WLIHVLDNGELPAVERAAAGRNLGLLGDPRFDPSNRYLPDEAKLGFVEIPEGEFQMGSDKKQDRYADDDEAPRHAVKLSKYHMGRYPVTVGQYSVFAEETGRRLDDEWKRWNRVDNHPVVMVTWHDASAYCEWLTGKFQDRGWEIRLPTEAEWEKAARGTDGRIYPWGNEADPDKGNYDDTDINTTSAVGCFPGGAGPYGILDMSGNVLEWVEDDRHDNYYGAPDDGSAWVDEPRGSGRVLRGGSWIYFAGRCRAAYRYGGGPGVRGQFVGFRLVLLPGHQGRQGVE
ncbi:MAG: formylglycine-generating enzyme family protein, partial [Desulfobacterales bacterium]|nr:formylglycine-generating enzyme family protein [Desulfobacterales bacterium]